LSSLYPTLTHHTTPHDRDMLIKTEELSIEIFGANSFERGRALTALAGCHGRLDKPAQAIAVLEQAVAISGYGECSDKTEKLAASNAYYNLGILSRDSEERKGESAGFFKKAMEMKIQGGLPSSHPDIVELKAILSAE
jgi:hypothetical protein